MENNPNNQNSQDNQSSQDNQKEQYYVPVNGELVEVDERIYRAYFRPIWQARYYARKNDECSCPIELLSCCDGICPGCEFYVPKLTVSLQSPISDRPNNPIYLDVLAGPSKSPEFLVLESELIETVYKAIHELEAENRRLCILLMHFSERETASIMGMSRASVRRRWVRIKKELIALLKDKFL